ncbi:hypothetical protein Celal_4094 [Cellulophaga algicola DSM 14237]|uniref:Uncharacterized protein n=1 Tax=Cellulophaga algicola (strain DSM 14237 / IC166 / ACAM 630) TaxID=688270 RepID=E6XEK8_CELAD|nr:hypothetical protein Celal_4094 [Cellulophaga algicola DSM 14237]
MLILNVLTINYNPMRKSILLFIVLIAVISIAAY